MILALALVLLTVGLIVIGLALAGIIYAIYSSGRFWSDMR